MYLSAFVHRDALFAIVERWFCGRVEPEDARQLTEWLISDGFVAAETVQAVARRLLPLLQAGPCCEIRLHTKGELRDALCRGNGDLTPRAQELLGRYQTNPDYYYRAVPINGVVCLDAADRVCGMYRLKRPRRIAEKAHRKLARWLMTAVESRARTMAAARAQAWGIPLDHLLTSPSEMRQEFIAAEEAVAQDVRTGAFAFDRTALTIRDVAGVKLVGAADALAALEAALPSLPGIRVVDRQVFDGRYRATSLVLEVAWDAEAVCRAYAEGRAWTRYRGRGVPDAQLQAGLGPFLAGAAPTLTIEVMLTTFPDLVESELGWSLHEQRIITQRDNREYTGYLPMNVEFLVEYLFAVAFSPQVEVPELPIKLWGRYLPDTLTSHIRRLYGLPDPDFLA
jgi:hypothetical protein